MKTKNQLNQETIDQLKSVEQEEKIISIQKLKNKIENIEIKSLKILIKLCEEKKELKIKYELENNLRLVSFKIKKLKFHLIQILINLLLKNLSAKLLEWTKKDGL